MRILVCNDDGVEAPGLAFLGEVAVTLSVDVWIVAREG
jgi:5'-nucleotidase